ncbi:MAG: branched-chain amino acid ABC transporter permease [Thaumarchaeota archaeon]|jgi:branched-chain amino acid transport system permease protein|nr:branched-chain amino acid ABC transporter permease [Nitrososphaerota archaeon]
MKRIYFLGGILVVFLILLPYFAGRFFVNAAILTLLFFSISVTWGFMAKHAWLVSLGQQIFVGVAGYTTAVLTMYYDVPLWLSVIVAGFVGMLLAGLLSFPLLRLRGFYFAIGTLVTAEIVKLLFIGWDYVGGGMGLIFRNVYGISLQALYYATVVLAFYSIFLTSFIYRSKLGFGLRALGNEEEAASGLGVNPFVCRSILFTLASSVASFAGALYAIFHPYVEPVTFFNINWTTGSVFVSIIGGVGTTIGPLFGSIVYVALTYLLSEYVGLSLLLQGVITAAFLLLCPVGLWGYLRMKLKR